MIHEPVDSNECGVSRRELAIFAHEVRGALTVISGYAEILRRSLSETERVRALDGIAHATRRIDRLVQSALEGSLDQGPERQLDLAQLAQGVVDEQREISGRDIDFEAHSHPAVRAAPEALERALGNLVGNALKYSPDNTPVSVNVTTDGEIALLTVADRGPGIPVAEREHVLEPFVRLEGHEDTPGTGLGLTVVRSIAESHGGRVLIDDRPGGGTAVTIAMPAVADKSATRG